jgi:hypothetical protein
MSKNRYSVFTDDNHSWAFNPATLEQESFENYFNAVNAAKEIVDGSLIHLLNTTSFHPKKIWTPALLFETYRDEGTDVFIVDNFPEKDSNSPMTWNCSDYALEKCKNLVK